MIKIENVSKIIKKKKVLENINLRLKPGEIILLKGHNGCGKTMLLRLMAGFIQPTNGNVQILDKIRFGVIIENPTFFEQETAYFNLKYLANINKLINNDVILDYMKKFNLYDVRNNKVKTFSLGMKQRLALCQAFMENPDILLLDEPFNAIDEENFYKIVEMINELKKEGKLIVIASHGDIESLKFDKIIKMNNGKITNINNKCKVV